MKSIKNRFTKWNEFRKNKKAAKREIDKIVSLALPFITDIVKRKYDLWKFIVKIIDESKNIQGEEFIQMILSEFSGKLLINEGKLKKHLQYILSLSGEDIQKIINNSIVNTNYKRNNDYN